MTCAACNRTALPEEFSYRFSNISMASVEPTVLWGCSPFLVFSLCPQFDVMRMSLQEIQLQPGSKLPCCVPGPQKSTFHRFVGWGNRWLGLSRAHRCYLVDLPVGRQLLADICRRWAASVSSNVWSCHCSLLCFAPVPLALPVVILYHWIH